MDGGSLDGPNDGPCVVLSLQHGPKLAAYL